jgi:hypothetical protein
MKNKATKRKKDQNVKQQDVKQQEEQTKWKARKKEQTCNARTEMN